jgi:DNA-binding NarL/FixJ family response regulator
VTTTAGELAAAAVAAFAAGDAETAVARARESLALEDEAPAHEVLAGLGYVGGDLPTAELHFRHAFRLHAAAGRSREAVRAALRLASMTVSLLGDEEAGRGWLEQARVLLTQLGPCVEWGYFEIALLSCDRNDVPALLASAERAIEIARHYGDRALELRARADRGLALVTSGRISDGFADLEMTMTALMAGELPLMDGGLCLCAMLTACDRVRDVRRAERWAGVTRDLMSAVGAEPAPLYVHCRMALGSVFRAAGRWPEAEQLLMEALGPEQQPFIWHRPLTSAHLASLRIEQGRYEEAGELLAPYEDWVSSSAPLALLHLKQGRPDVAAAVLEGALVELVDDALRRAPVLAALVQVELSRGQVDAAAAAAEELAALADRTEASSVRGDAALATARLAAARGAPARTAYATALRNLEERPFTAGLVRLELAESLAPTDPAAAIAEARAALACFTRLGATEARDRAAALLRELGDTSRPRGSVGLGELTEREADVLSLVQVGLSNAAIGERLYISGKTVEHHVSRILAKLGVRTRAEAAALAVRLGAK